MCSRFPHLTLQNVAAHKRVKYADPFVKQLSHLDVVVAAHACHSSNTLSGRFAAPDGCFRASRAPAI